MEIKQTVGKHGQVFNDAIAIRMAVFVKEQQVPEELEKDDGDAIATHYVGYVGGLPVVTLRIIKEGVQVHVQRVATIKNSRHHGYAAELLNDVLHQISADGEAELVYLGAQLTAIGFYETLGFETVGPIFLDAGIQHKRMELRLK
ncbi:GNAT family N-acetyltransferase [Paucilactobacillus suebicus]|uniref:GNAT family acetyltransferase n=1 Tax=Paucilactobacillus suebicus DSM 5007 = KCTC 3549 TaxID=1423807 RepID=A0A0R1WBN2_9LACO|nr:GNAT family N-acetyltransferase [Paucilactobacillus suebicus]KRM12987.1 GNAT family acetyltransferase [Paucilactobacillus suebicus DSM 5007 = KCTC 3549]